ncbi:MAG TPA: tetratricopeptide repeat protein [Sedimentisphaerales bacterium]|nr:tetratricopeptide repeat protein [Sedimentisphaerales bacterium]
MGKTPKKNGRSTGVWLGVAIFVLALSVRGLYLYESSDNPTFRAPIVDSLTYDQMARRLVGGEGLTPDFFWQQFFYPFFLSLVYFFTSCSVVSARIIQLLLGAVTCVLTYRLGAKIFGRPAGVLAGLTVALHGPLMFFEGELLAAGWAAFWAALLILLFLTTAKKKSVWMCVVLGLCGALSVITRPNFIPFFAAGSAWLAAVWLRGHLGPKRVALGLLGMAAGFLAVTVPVASQNYRLTGSFTFLPGTGGLNLYIGNNPDFEAVSIRPGIEWQRIVDLPLKEGRRSRTERQEFFYARTFEYMRAEPMSFLKGLLHKGTEFFSSREMPGNIDIYLFTRWSRLLGVLTWKLRGFGFPFGVLLPLSLLGLFFYPRKVPAPVWLFLILYPASVILTHVEARYRVPVVPPVCILAGAALVRIAELVRAGDWRRLTAAGIFCAGICFVCSVAGPFYSERHINYEAELCYGLGDSLEKRGRTEQAIEAYSTAVTLRGDYVEAYHNMALLLVQQRRVPEAIANFNTALELDPENSELHKDLGMALSLQGQSDQAISHYRKALELDPANAKAHSYLGLALAARGSLEEAVRHYREAIRLEPNDADVHYSLGVALQLQAKPAEAVEQYNEALRINPDLFNAHSNLGVIYAAQGKLDQAIGHFTEAVRIKPAPGIYCNLGIALQSQGKINKATQAFKKALAIDPNHKQARQALDKLQTSNP